MEMDSVCPNCCSATTNFLIKEILDNGVLNSDVSTSVPNQNVFNNDVYYSVKEEVGHSEYNNDVPKDVLNQEISVNEEPDCSESNNWLMTE